MKRRSLSFWAWLAVVPLMDAAVANRDPSPAGAKNPWFAGPPSPPPKVVLGAGRQLLVDDFVIEATTLQRVFHQPSYHTASPVLRPEHRWEGTVAIPMSDGVWYDPATRLFKMWYRAGTPPKQATCYATSRDGIHWEKPMLDVVTGTNIVLPERHASGTMWLDRNEKDAAKRYKYFHSESRTHPLGYAKGQWGLSLHYSADGIHWSDVIRRTGWVGDRTTVFYNPFREAWVYSIRNPDWSTPRKRFYWETRNLEGESSWDLDRNPPLAWTGADARDPVYPGVKGEAELYNLDAVAYESLLLGLFTILRSDFDNQSPVEPGRPKANNVCVGFSRDGFHWDRPDRTPFMNYGEEPKAWNWGNVQSVAGCCVVMGDQLYFYTAGRTGTPSARDDGASTGVAVLRRDGFASLDAAGQPGTLTTRPLVFYGTHLFVNAATGRGALRVEVLDADGGPLAGHAADQCEPMRGDSTLQEIRWRGGKDLAGLAGQTVRLRFHLDEGSLYAFWVSVDESGASQGFVAAGGPGYTGDRDTRGRAALDEALALRR